MAAADDETEADIQAPSGTLSPAGRRAAVAATLPLLGLYFASGNQALWEQSAVARSADEVADEDKALTSLLAGVRLRVAIAAANRLHQILIRIVERPSFRYQLESAESTGALTGQLDINKFVLRSAFTEDVPTYPVLTVKRTEQTAENVLAVYACLWLQKELRAAFRASTAEPVSAEHAEYQSRRQTLTKVLQLPTLAGCVARASELSRRNGERQLVNDVKRRLRRREVANPSPYHDLVKWVDGCLAGKPVAEPGEIEWAFYGDRFDTKLFELWCLNVLAREVSSQLAVPHPNVNLGWRTGAPAFSWNRPAGELKLYFQRSLATISPSHKSRWVRADDETKTLGGIPDLVAHAVRREDGRERFAILDPKLRQRDSSPTDELYKIIGYLNNFGLEETPLGAILYYSAANDLPTFAYKLAGKPGQLLALALNPAAFEGSRNQIQRAATMLLEMLDIPRLDHLVPAAGSTSEQGDAEQALEGYAAARRQEILALSLALPPATLEASRRRVRAMIGDQCWQVLPDHVRTMLATSEHVGFSLDSSADFSGPVIGICASVEVILHMHVIEPVTTRHPHFANDCRTLGQAIYALRRATAGNTDPLSRAIRHQLTTIGADQAALITLIGPLSTMNSGYRIPAAHRDLVTESTWQAAWSRVIGQGALLRNVIDAICTQPTTGAVL